MRIIRTGSILQDFDAFFLSSIQIHRRCPTFAWSRSGSALLLVTTTTSVRFSDRVLGATGDNCLLSLVCVDSHIEFTVVRKPWVLKVIVDDTRTLQMRRPSQIKIK